MLQVEDSLATLGDSPWIVRGWGQIWPWSFAADDVSDIFSVSTLSLQKLNILIALQTTLEIMSIFSDRQSSFVNICNRMH